MAVLLAFAVVASVTRRSIVLPVDDAPEEVRQMDTTIKKIRESYESASNADKFKDFKGPKC